MRLHRVNGVKHFRRFVSNQVIGIDLGTTNSAVAVVNSKGIPTIIENDEGKRTTPSVVAITKDDKVLVGEAAKRQAVLNSANTFFATKRLIGRKYSDAEVQRDLNNSPYKIVPDPETSAATLQTQFSGKVTNYTPSQIGAYVLEKMKSVAEDFLNTPVKNAVVTVPAYFNDAQRQATKHAGELSGLKVLRVLNEPTAAALAYGLDSKKDGLVAVYDLGGGTFDISILDIDDGVFQVISTNGDTHLGGEDFDILLMKKVVDKFKEETGVDLFALENNNVIVQRIREACETAKIELSHVKETSISLPFIHEQHSIKFTLTEDELDAMSMPLIEKTIKPLEKALSDSELEPSDIDEVILVGGMTRMPKIRKLVEEFFNKKPNITVNPDEAVALGAAIQGAVLSGEIRNVLLLDVTPLTLGIETYGGIYSPLIPRNTTIPTNKKQVFSTAVDGQTGVEISVYQGERPLVKDNKLIGHFKLSNIPVLPKGEPQIEVSFDINADGIIEVTAKDLKTNQDASIKVEANSGLTEEDVKKMIEEAEKNKELDKQKQIALEHANRADLLVSDALVALEKFKIDTPEKEQLQGELTQKIEKLQQMVKDTRAGAAVNVAELKNNTDELQKFASKVFTKLLEK